MSASSHNHSLFPRDKARLLATSLLWQLNQCISNEYSAQICLSQANIAKTIKKTDIWSCCCFCFFSSSSCIQIHNENRHNNIEIEILPLKFFLYLVAQTSTNETEKHIEKYNDSTPNFQSTMKNKNSYQHDFEPTTIISINCAMNEVDFPAKESNKKKKMKRKVHNGINIERMKNFHVFNRNKQRRYRKIDEKVLTEAFEIAHQLHKLKTLDLYFKKFAICKRNKFLILILIFIKKYCLLEKGKLRTGVMKK